MKSTPLDHPRYMAPDVFHMLKRFKRPFHGSPIGTFDLTLKGRKRQFRQHRRATMVLGPDGFPDSSKG